MPARLSASAISLLRTLAAAGTCGLLAAALAARPERVALAWGPALDPPPPPAPTLASTVERTVAARLTADDLARGLAGLAALPASDRRALRSDQAARIAPALRRALDARARASALRAALPARRRRARAAFAPLVALLPESRP